MILKVRGQETETNVYRNDIPDIHQKAANIIISTRIKMINLVFLAFTKH